MLQRHGSGQPKGPRLGDRLARRNDYLDANEVPHVGRHGGHSWTTDEPSDSNGTAGLRGPVSAADGSPFGSHDREADAWTACFLLIAPECRSPAMPRDRRRCRRPSPDRIAEWLDGILAAPGSTVSLGVPAHPQHDGYRRGPRRCTRRDRPPPHSLHRRAQPHLRPRRPRHLPHPLRAGRAADHGRGAWCM